MKTQQQVLEAIQNKNTWNRDSCDFVDQRDFSRLADYFPSDQWKNFGFELADDVDESEIKIIDWTEENIIVSLEGDIQFAIDKAEGERGISANLMFEVICMWLWILDDDELLNNAYYTNYGKDFFYEVDEKYFG